MTIRELLKMRSNEKKLSSLIFEFVDYMEEDLKSALLKEFACLFDDDKEEELIKQLEEYHPERFTSFEEDKIISIIEEVLDVDWLDYKPARERKGFIFKNEGALFDININEENNSVSITTHKQITPRKAKHFIYISDFENFKEKLLKALEDLKGQFMTLEEYNNLKLSQPIKIMKYYDKGRTTKAYIKTTSGKYKGFIVGNVFYRYQDCEIIKGG